MWPRGVACSKLLYVSRDGAVHCQGRQWSVSALYDLPLAHELRATHYCPWGCVCACALHIYLWAAVCCESPLLVGTLSLPVLFMPLPRPLQARTQQLLAL